MSYLLLEQATEIKRDDDGRAWTWTSGKEIARFYDSQAFTKYVDEHIKGLKNAVAFTGSASLIIAANTYLGNKLKENGLI